MRREHLLQERREAMARGKDESLAASDGQLFELERLASYLRSVEDEG
jgi:hypothetical protein